jgi:hypothetical protein
VQTVCRSCAESIPVCAEWMEEELLMGALEARAPAKQGLPRREGCVMHENPAPSSLDIRRSHTCACANRCISKTTHTGFASALQQDTHLRDNSSFLVHALLQKNLCPDRQ